MAPAAPAPSRPPPPPKPTLWLFGPVGVHVGVDGGVGGGRGGVGVGGVGVQVGVHVLPVLPHGGVARRLRRRLLRLRVHHRLARRDRVGARRAGCRGAVRAHHHLVPLRRAARLRLGAGGKPARRHLLVRRRRARGVGRRLLLLLLLLLRGGLPRGAGLPALVPLAARLPLALGPRHAARHSRVRRRRPEPLVRRRRHGRVGEPLHAHAAPGRGGPGRGRRALPHLRGRRRQGEERERWPTGTSSRWKAELHGTAMHDLPPQRSAEL